MKRTTRAWVRKAESDHRMAGRAAGPADPEYDQVCFHCQQLVEKYLKAVLEELGEVVPRTHDLDALLDQLLPHYPELRAFRRGARFLTAFAVAVRYPGFNASRRRAEAALRWAGRIRGKSRELLGIRPGSP